MTWREALIRQAAHDWDVYERLNPEVFSVADQLHYLQMTTEKLAKGLLTPGGSAFPPQHSLARLVRFLQTLKHRPNLRKNLGYPHAASFSAFINSLLPLAQQIENLAPAIAGDFQPNPEYPWLDRVTGRVHTPCDFTFPDFNPRNSKLIQFEKMMRGVFSTVNQI